MEIYKFALDLDNDLLPGNLPIRSDSKASFIRKVLPYNFVLSNYWGKDFIFLPELCDEVVDVENTCPPQPKPLGNVFDNLEVID